MRVTWTYLREHGNPPPPLSEIQCKSFSLVCFLSWFHPPGLRRSLILLWAPSHRMVPYRCSDTRVIPLTSWMFTQINSAIFFFWGSWNAICCSTFSRLLFSVCRSYPNSSPFMKLIDMQLKYEDWQGDVSKYLDCTNTFITYSQFSLLHK